MSLFCRYFAAHLSFIDKLQKKVEGLICEMDFSMYYFGIEF